MGRHIHIITEKLRMFHVMFPTETEAAPFIGALEDARAGSLAHRRSYAGVVSGREVSVVVCGIGQANAAQAVTSILETAKPGLLILGGCAGAYPGSGLAVGDVAVASEEIYADLGVNAPGGFLSMEDAGLALLDTGGGVYSSIPIKAGAALHPDLFSGLGFKAAAGRFLTVSTVSGTLARGKELFGRYGALCENMEGAAAAQVALLYGADLIELRGISNLVEDRDRDSWDIGLAGANCAKAIERLIGGWKG